MHIALCGPCAPRRLGDLLNKSDARLAGQMEDTGATAVVELARALHREGHRISVVTLGETGVAQAPVSLSGPRLSVHVFTERARPRDYLKDVYAAERFAMATALRDLNPDIVHTHWTYEYELAAQDARVLHVTTARDAPWRILGYSRDAYRLARLAVALRARPGIRHLSAVSPYLAMSWKNAMAYRREIRVIPNPMPTDVGGLPRNPLVHPVILDVADSSRRKNVKSLLRAFGLLQSRIPNAELRLAGQGLAEGDVAWEWARRAGLLEGVTFLGMLGRQEIRYELSRAWLLAHSSLEESFGNVLVEAMSAGVPVLAGVDSGGVPYVLGYGVCGSLTSVNKPEVFASAMEECLQNGPDRVRAIPAECLGRFSPDVVASAYLDWYEGVLDAPGRS